MNVTKDVNLRNVQEQVGDNVQQARKIAHRSALAYIGLWGLAYDFAKDTYAGSVDLLDKAEERGEGIVRELNEQLDRYQEQATDEAKKARSRVEGQVEGVTKTITANTETLQKNANKVLTRMGMAAGDMAADVAATVIEVKSELAPFADYDEMTAKEVTDKLGELNVAELKVARAYEAGTKNRVTVLRHIDELLADAQQEVAA